MKKIDVLGSWQENEYYVSNYFNNPLYIQLSLLDPFWSEKPWTMGLEGKKVLVVHPFQETIIEQYGNRDNLFARPILPEFKLETVKAIQSLGGYSSFSTWFDGLDYMKRQIASKEFDVCLIGAGAYGLPLAAYVKDLGKQAIHVGGSLQLYFGIRGKRWESKDYNKIYDYSGLMNDAWVRPLPSDFPKNFRDVENGCYW